MQRKSFETEDISSNSFDFKVSVYLLFLNKSCVSRVFSTEGGFAFAHLSVQSCQLSYLVQLPKCITVVFCWAI